MFSEIDSIVLLTPLIAQRRRFAAYREPRPIPLAASQQAKGSLKQDCTVSGCLFCRLYQPLPQRFGRVQPFGAQGVGFIRR